ncbi:hypothetical protein U9M48_027704 [Paspalum notatum var. saurae]|uniref:Uncharacterized protein n=1 Tax=Paspalum notatum var. saurae TaxID=547442 RepID=A0AAQ3X0C9_PASNO
MPPASRSRTHNYTWAPRPRPPPCPGRWRPRGRRRSGSAARPRIAAVASAPTGRALLLNPGTIPSPLHSPAPSSLAPRSLSASLSPERRAPPARAALAASSHTGRRKPSPPRPTRFLRSPHPPPSPRLILSPRRRLLHLSPRAPTRHRHSRRRLAVESPLWANPAPGDTTAPAPRRPRASDARDNAAAQPLPHRPEPRRRATPSRCAVRFAASAPPVCASPHDETYGEEFPVGGNTSRCLVGSKSGLTAAGAAPPSSLPARGSPPPKIPRTKDQRRSSHKPSSQKTSPCTRCQKTACR